jgi:hypothetical protein
MGSLYVKGAKLWARYKDEHGAWKGAPTPYRPGDEANARRFLKGLESATEAKTSFRKRTGSERKSPITVAEYAGRWPMTGRISAWRRRATTWLASGSISFRCWGRCRWRRSDPVTFGTSCWRCEKTGCACTSQHSSRVCDRGLHVSAGSRRRVDPVHPLRLGQGKPPGPRTDHHDQDAQHLPRASEKKDPPLAPQRLAAFGPERPTWLATGELDGSDGT